MDVYPLCGPENPRRLHAPHPDRPHDEEGDQEQEDKDLDCVQTRSISVPVPRPPPQHIVTKPIDLSERSISCSSVVIRRAPVEPSGWPMAIAPPLTLTRSMSGLCSRCQAATTGANASLISNRSMSLIDMPLRSRIFVVAGIGPSSISTGSQPTVVWSTMRARGVRPSRLAFSALISSTAAAPSDTCDALPAVILPSSLKTGLSCESVSRSVFGRIPWSVM